MYFMKIFKIITGIVLFSTALTLMSYTSRQKETAFVLDNMSVLEGKQLFKQKCSACHVLTKPTDMSKLIAPPITEVMMQIKNGIVGEGEFDKRENAIIFIVDYVRNPSAKKSMLEAHAIERFDVMPSQKLNVTRKEAKIIAKYLYDNF